MVQSLTPNLVLIGFMGCGKSTIGRLCARELRFRFTDTDARIEKQTGCAIAELFAREGEAAFRELERRAVSDLAMRANVVIATGGGAVLDPANVAALRGSGVLIWLYVEPEETLRRCGTRASRPLLADVEDPLARVQDLLAKREPFYQAAADAQVVTTGLRRETAARAVLEAYRGLASQWPHLPGRSAPA